LSGVVSGDNISTVTTNVTAAFDNKNAGNAKPVSLSGSIVLTGADATNYTLTQPAGMTANITTKNLTLTNFVVAGKAYDGNSAATISDWGTLSGVVSGDNISTVTTNITAAFNNKHAGTGKPVSLSGSIALTGSDATNYTLTQPAGLSADITAKNLTLANFAVADKAYDGNSAATISNWGTLSGVVSGDHISTVTTNVTAAFNNKHAGAGKAVSLSGSIALSGTDAGNYRLTQPAGLTASIIPKNLTLSGITVANKTYNGNTSATVSYWGSLSGIVAGETVNINTSGVSALFSNKNAGNNKPVVLSGSISLSGTNVGNYTLAQQPAGLTASIIPKTLTLAGTSIAHKVYDGNSAATVGNWGALNGVVSGDDVNINTAGVSALFNNRNAANNKPVMLSGNIALSGTEAGNYVLQQPAGLAANITPRNLAVENIAIANKEYDGNTSAAVSNWGTLNGIVSGDNVRINTAGTTVLFDSKHVSNNRSVRFNGVLSGTDAGNYTLIQPAGLSAAITVKSVMLTGISIGNKVYDGSTSAIINNWGTLNSVPGDNVSIYTVGVSASFNDKHIGNNKPVTLAGTVFLAGTDAENYILIQQPAGLTASIVPKTLTLAGTSIAHKVYDGNTLATVENWGILNGVVSGDDVNINTAGVSALFDNKNAANNKRVMFGGNIALSGTEAGNYVLQQPAGLAANITPRSLTLTGFSIFDREYDGTTVATVEHLGTLNGVVAGDDARINMTNTAALFNDKNAGYNKPVALSGYMFLSGTDAGNYTLAQQPAGITADIIPRSLTLTGTVVADKIYDGNSAATINHWGTLNGIVAGDNINMNVAGITASFNDQEVGDDKPVALSATVTLSGTDVNNYILVQPSGLTGNIKPSAIAELTVNGERIDIPVGNHLRYVLPCGTDNAMIHATAIYPGNVTVDGNAAPCQFFFVTGSRDLSVTVTAADNSSTRNYTLTIVRPLENVVLQVWDDVLSVINNPDHNGGYTFTSYQWQADGVDLPGETGGNLYLAYRPDALSAAYSVLLTTSGGEVLQTCPVSLTAPSLRVYPNPVTDYVTLESSALTSGEAVKVYSDTGLPVYSGVAEGKRTKINLSSLQPGVYVLQVKERRVRVVKR
jgi:hypothetical protein